MTERAARPLDSEAATRALAQELAALARPGDVLLLSGELGAGKSVFARAFINALPGPVEEVPSPTFTLVQTYHRGYLKGGNREGGDQEGGDQEGGGLDVWHFDLYRLESPDEVWELGLEEALGEGVSLIEWPERLGHALPPSRLEIEFSHGDSESRREARITPYGSWTERLASGAA
ncbi:tRNA (adenosine(37)-N6)-threonylcarbamoyltransferase complex ATPase subunit type 1 TsaE [Fodinicurvata sediminis]|uniref:tRNA (adenosine(37)-N6)-threonylcarbamoyltransferase complex ATPase subunit type 1 TsaE n=1 Tax=Fodinicurvata sediminis TaxID=1121832 RepID=UPI0003B3BC7C|nr:tRNA (adenosine(37)-N6)-threonylcarbamoyltransferase complex ATPase subunit type 1 TsaE [Fodinicurvata sediminis]